MVKEEITKRHYFSEEEIKQLLQLPEGCTIERIEQIDDIQIREDSKLKDYKAIITTIENIDLEE